MGKKIEILGMSLDNDTVQEAMLQIESCWDKSTISTRSEERRVGKECRL